MPEPLLLCADSGEVLRDLADNTFDAVVTDPPYGLSEQPDMAEVLRHWLAGDDYTHRGGGFMGKSWDSFVPGPSLWREVFRVLKPGGHALVFAGTRTVDLMGISLRLAGFQIRDQCVWLYGQGVPKSKATALKPGHEPILVARKPLVGTIDENVAIYGTGALNIDRCRIAFQSDSDRASAKPQGRATSKAKHIGAEPDAGNDEDRIEFVPADNSLGRWPANVLHDGSDAVIEALPEAPGQLAKTRADGAEMGNAVYGAMRHGTVSRAPREDDTKSAARFFYCAKAKPSEKDAGCERLPSSEKGRKNTHNTVKPVELMRWLVRLVTPSGGTVLDPFMGSGTTGVAAVLEGAGFVGIEREPEYAAIAEARVQHHFAGAAK